MSEVGQHYTGAAGRRYFAAQRKVGMLGAVLSAPWFAAHVPPEATVVDFGCGGGFMLEALPGREKIGIEPNDVARGTAGARGLRVVPRSDDLDDCIADVVTCNHVLEHVLSPADELRGLLRILKPDGKLVLLLPLDDWRRQRRADPNDPNHHLFAWTPLLLGNLLTEVGFSVQDIGIVTRAWPPGARQLHRLPLVLFERLSFAWSVIDQRRQIAGTARKPGHAPIVP